MTYVIVFVVASVVAIAAARSRSSLSPNPFFSALSLIGNLTALAALYLLLGSPSSSPPRRCSSTAGR